MDNIVAHFTFMLWLCYYIQCVRSEMSRSNLAFPRIRHSRNDLTSSHPSSNVSRAQTPDCCLTP
ncbi:hypothetical protein BJX68DRAFT_226094 [Aspergillus pseudodeflectus]|uniref:Uncharacterized protein n=1 Tax=Aspergillus pseudodeflectus TaxID=176178 RepID=A0ABR4L409_9EURO